nr:MAG TPA: hypothetical protein [Caudoviricetes sp.]
MRTKSSDKISCRTTSPSGLSALIYKGFVADGQTDGLSLNRLDGGVVHHPSVR